MKPGSTTHVVAFLLLAATGLGADEPARADSLLESPQPFADALDARFGKGLRIRSLIVQAASADVEAQDPVRPDNVDRYSFEEGVLGAPEPVQAGRNRRDREARLFRFVEVDLSLVPYLLADARRRAETPEARVIQVVIERSQSYGDSELWGWPLMRFTVDGPRGGAVVEYDLKGGHKRTSRW
jgi:hypothetical protein